MTGASEKRGLEAWMPEMSLAQTAASVVGLGAACWGGAQYARRLMYPHARPVERLHRRLRSAGAPLQGARVGFALNPYEHLSPGRAVILQGRNREGKTTLLRTAIPWYRRWLVAPYMGIYLNGAKGKGVDSFKEWQTTQMFGMTTTGGSEIDATLKEHRESQWLRMALEAMGLPIGPRPAFIVVDQFEELLIKYRRQALDWANTLTNQHVRDGLARVVFVVNSDAGATSLLNLNQGSRFNRVVMEPASGDAPGLDATLFERCKRNIGMYKMAEEAMRRGEVTEGELDVWIEEKFDEWETDFHLPYPIKYDRSWKKMPEADMKEKLAEVLEPMLRAKRKTDGTVAFTAEKVDAMMGFVWRCIEVLDQPQTLDAPEELWVERLMSVGAEKPVAENLAKLLMSIIGNPAPRE